MTKDENQNPKVENEDFSEIENEINELNEKEAEERKKEIEWNFEKVIEEISTLKDSLARAQADYQNLLRRVVSVHNFKYRSENIAFCRQPWKTYLGHSRKWTMQRSFWMNEIDLHVNNKNPWFPMNKIIWINLIRSGHRSPWSHESATLKRMNSDPRIREMIQAMR